MKKTPDHYIHAHQVYAKSFVRSSACGCVTYIRNNKQYTYSGMIASIHDHQKRTLAKIRDYYYAEFKKQHNIM